MNVKFDPVSSERTVWSPQKTPDAITDTYRSRRPSLYCGHTLTLEAELRVFLAPEFLRLAVKRPQIRDAAMSPSTAQ